MKIFYLMFIVLSPITIYTQLAQGNQQLNQDPYQNPIVQKYYSAADLDEIQSQHPEKLEKLVYYYTRSFIIEASDCKDCLPFDITQFDITSYEYLRKKDSRTKKETKYGVTVTLLSTDELEHKLPIHEPQIPSEDE